MAANSTLPPLSARATAGALRPRVGEVEFPGDAFVEQIEMGPQDDAGLNHVQVMQLAWVRLREAFGQEVSLLLVVALQADPVARPDPTRRLCRPL
jgi:hypothetical protein